MVVDSLAHLVDACTGSAGIHGIGFECSSKCTTALNVRSMTKVVDTLGAGESLVGIIGSGWESHGASSAQYSGNKNGESDLRRRRHVNMVESQTSTI